jgi:hypothetical protein
MDSFRTPLDFASFSIPEPLVSSYWLFSLPSLLAPGSTVGGSWVAHLGWFVLGKSLRFVWSHPEHGSKAIMLQD